MRFESSFACLCAAALGLGAAGCAGPALLREARAPLTSLPAASAEDPRVRATVEAIVLRNNALAWSRDAEWDEYVIRIRSLSSEPLEIRGVAIFDALDHRLESRSERNELVDGTRETELRYEKSGKVVRTAAASGWAVSGAVVGGAAVAAGATAPGILVGGAATLAVAVPIALGVGLAFAGAGVKRVIDNAQVQGEIKRRASLLPVTLQPGAETRLDMFFPSAPLSSHAEVVYADRRGEHRLDIGTREALQELEWEAPPTLVSRVDPEFPDRARRMGLREGYVIAHLTLDRKGHVRDVRIERSVPPFAFEQEAHRALRWWTYSEGRNDGRAVEVRLDFKR